MRSRWIALGIGLVLVLVGSQAAVAKEQYVYSVKFVCGFNPSNTGVSSADHSKNEGEPSVKFGNYATEINILWPEIYLGEQKAFIFKHVAVLVDRGKPVGREPNVVNSAQYVDSVQLGSLQATMDDCNRIWELLNPGGAVPTPMPLMIGYFSITSTHELEVTAVYTAEVCSNWTTSDGSPLPATVECIDSTKNSTSGMGISIDVERIPGRKLLLQ